MKNSVCLVDNLVDIPMPSADESQNDKSTSKEGAVTSNTNTLQQSPTVEERIDSSDKTQTDLHRQFNLISVPPPPPPSDPKTFVTNTVIATQRAVKFILSFD